MNLSHIYIVFIIALQLIGMDNFLRVAQPVVYTSLLQDP